MSTSGQCVTCANPYYARDIQQCDTVLSNIITRFGEVAAAARACGCLVESSTYEEQPKASHANDPCAEGSMCTIDCVTNDTMVDLTMAGQATNVERRLLRDRLILLERRLRAHHAIIRAAQSGTHLASSLRLAGLPAIDLQPMVAPDSSLADAPCSIVASPSVSPVACHKGISASPCGEPQAKRQRPQVAGEIRQAAEVQEELDVPAAHRGARLAAKCAAVQLCTSAPGLPSEVHAGSSAMDAEMSNEVALAGEEMGANVLVVKPPLEEAHRTPVAEQERDDVAPSRSAFAATAVVLCASLLDANDILTLKAAVKALGCGYKKSWDTKVLDVHVHIHAYRTHLSASS